MKMSNLDLDYIKYNTYQLVNCPQPTTQAAVDPCRELTLTEARKKLKEEKKGSDMYDLDFCEDETMDMTKLNHLSNRMSTAFSTKKQELAKKFGLMDDDPPMTAKDLIARITAGKYVVAEDKMTVSAYEPTRFFTWRDPSVKKDEEGFKAAEVALRKARTAAEDIIVVMSDEATRLKALQDFESATIQ